ncbi:hypothetical protein [Aquimarina macrocephali]|uniref:hypothetical protein n=1 Tax=Aquimarina macrocephali TaxID=666563 RepID=UPI003F675107
MRAKIRLDGRKNVETKEGFPIIIYLTKNSEDKPIRIGYFSSRENWDNNNALPKKKHPDYIELLNYLEQKKIQVKKLIADAKNNNISLLQAEKILSGNTSGLYYNDAIKVANKLPSKVYLHALNSFNDFYPGYRYEDITKSVVKDYVNALLVTPVKNTSQKRNPNGVIVYIDKLSALWNILTEKNNPFKGSKPKKEKTKNKALSKTDLIRIRDNDYKVNPNVVYGGKRNYLNYFMLCFYFGGIDMVDLKNLRYDKHVINGRIEFRRHKGGTNVLVSNKIFPEAQKILDLYDCKPYLVPLNGRYSSFRQGIYTILDKLRDELKLTKKPYFKSPRYTFITRAQQMLIDERITIEIVGHSQQSTHSIYKDEFPFHVRDEAHEKIISLD